MSGDAEGASFVARMALLACPWSWWLESGAARQLLAIIMMRNWRGEVLSLPLSIESLAWAHRERMPHPAVSDAVQFPAADLDALFPRGYWRCGPVPWPLSEHRAVADHRILACDLPREPRSPCSER